MRQCFKTSNLMAGQFIPKLCKVSNFQTFDELQYREHVKNINECNMDIHLGIGGEVLLCLACWLIFLVVTILGTSVYF